MQAILLIIERYVLSGWDNSRMHLRTEGKHAYITVWYTSFFSPSYTT
jgi:hypothetical protein